MEPWARFGKRIKGISRTAKISKGAEFNPSAKRKKQKEDILSIIASLDFSVAMNRVPFYRRIFRQQGR